jgi:ligand-binding sensor protein
MISRKAVDISITSNKGLVNTNFGKIIYGQETEIQFLNGFRNYIVTDEEYLENFDVITSGNYKNNIDNSLFVLYDID